MHKHIHIHTTHTHLLLCLSCPADDAEHGGVAVQQHAGNVQARLDQATRVVTQVQDVPSHTLALQKQNTPGRKKRKAPAVGSGNKQDGQQRTARTAKGTSASSQLCLFSHRQLEPQHRAPSAGTAVSRSREMHVRVWQRCEGKYDARCCMALPQRKPTPLVMAVKVHTGTGLSTAKEAPYFDMEYPDLPPCAQ